MASTAAAAASVSKTKTAITVDEAIQSFLQHMENIESSSPQTLRAYNSDLQQAFRENFKSKFNEQNLLQWSRQAQQQWGSLASSSRNRKTATLKSFLNFLFSKKWITKSLAEILVSPKVAKKLPNTLSVDEILHLIKKCENSEEKLLLLLLYGGGLRVSEACQLQAKNITQNGKALRLRGKGDKERIVILPEMTTTHLKPILKNLRPSDSIWGEKPLDTRRAYQMVRDLGVKAGLLRPIHPHCLRHSYATHMLTAGADLRALQELLGHSSLTATEKYTHLNLQHLAQTLEKRHPLKSLKTPRIK